MRQVYNLSVLCILAEALFCVLVLCLRVGPSCTCEKKYTYNSPNKVFQGVQRSCRHMSMRLQNLAACGAHLHCERPSECACAVTNVQHTATPIPDQHGCLHAIHRHALCVGMHGNACSLMRYAVLIDAQLQACKMTQARQIDLLDFGPALPCLVLFVPKSVRLVRHDSLRCRQIM